MPPPERRGAALPRVDQLFPSQVRVEVAAPSEADVAGLFAEERAAVARAVERRVREFATARACARRAMAGLGVARGPLLSDEERAPLWPAGVVGTIAHTRGLCAVAVARASDYRSLGLDVEPEEPVATRLWERICAGEELARVRALGEREGGLLARVLFSAKECFYKCQHPVTRTFLGFGDVSLEVEAERFEVTLLRDAGPLRAGARYEGRILREAGFVTTAMGWPGAMDLGDAPSRSA